jgi:hypothetical protein
MSRSSHSFDEGDDVDEGVGDRIVGSDNGSEKREERYFNTFAHSLVSWGHFYIVIIIIKVITTRYDMFLSSMN